MGEVAGMRVTLAQFLTRAPLPLLPLLPLGSPGPGPNMENESNKHGQLSTAARPVRRAHPGK